LDFSRRFPALNSNRAAAMPDNASAPEDPQRVAEAQASYREDFDPAVAGVHAFDRLQKADFTPDQAESVVLTVRELVGDLATKNDIVRLEANMATKEANMATKDDLVALRTEMGELKTELKTEMAELKSELKTEIKDSIHKSIFWTIGIIVGTLLAGMGIATTVIIAAMMRLFA